MEEYGWEKKTDRRAEGTESGGNQMVSEELPKTQSLSTATSPALGKGDRSGILGEDPSTERECQTSVELLDYGKNSIDR